jgi:YD repeat-containing protein
MRGAVAQLRETSLFDRDSADAIPDSLGKQDTYTVIDYNRAGNVTRMDVFTGADSVHTSSEEYLYDPTGGQLRRVVSRLPSQNLYSAVRYEYDERGRLVRETDEAWGWHVDLGYDRHGYLKTWTDSTYNKDKLFVTRYRYDRFGRLRVEKSIKGGDPKQRHSYHPGGTTIARTRYGKTETYTYDERGNLASTTSIVKERNLKGRVKRRFPLTITARYDYDARGNWIRRVQFYKDRVQGLFLREIDYYDQ